MKDLFEKNDFRSPHIVEAVRYPKAFVKPVNSRHRTTLGEQKSGCFTTAYAFYGAGVSHRYITELESGDPRPELLRESDHHEERAR